MSFLRRSSTIKASLLALLAASSVLSLAHAEDAPEHRIIGLQAEVSRDVQNDLMQATLFAELSNNNPTVLAKDINEIINTAMSTAKRYSNVQVSTGSQNTYPVYNDKNKLTSWRSRAEVQITSTDFKAASELVALLQANMQVASVSFSVSPEQQRKVENDLMSEVSAVFRQRASLLQQSWSANGYELVRMDINSSNDQPRPYPMYARAASMKMEDAVAPQQVEAGNSKVRVMANGSIQLK
jgi:predicted secreted protein